HNVGTTVEPDDFSTGCNSMCQPRQNRGDHRNQDRIFEPAVEAERRPRVISETPRGPQTSPVGITPGEVHFWSTPTTCAAWRFQNCRNNCCDRHQQNVV